MNYSQQCMAHIRIHMWKLHYEHQLKIGCEIGNLLHISSAIVAFRGDSVLLAAVNLVELLGTIFHCIKAK